MEEDYFLFSENLPTEWSFMEFDVPVVRADGGEQWVRARVERETLSTERTLITVTVEDNPFSKLIIRPWLEEAQLESFSPDQDLEEEDTPGHQGWVFRGQSGEVVLTLHH